MIHSKRHGVVAFNKCDMDFPLRR